MKTEPVIGIEVHAELITNTKMFCPCANDPFDQAPNVVVCPVCLGLPGALPTINKEAVMLGIRAALALSCTLAPKLAFERKNYHYPDLVKGYQISQKEMPIGTGGKVRIWNRDGEEKSIRIREIHLEEDTGKLIHDKGTDGPASFLDYNRSGVPLLEIVSEPDIKTVEEAEQYLRNLRYLLVHNNISHCRMQRGEMRLEANISIQETGSGRFGDRVEIKNQSSFRFVREALGYEIERQTSLVEAGQKVLQETRGYDPDTKQTFVMRTKEELHDYRYFPEPDLPPIFIDPAWIVKQKDMLAKSLDDFRSDLTDQGFAQADINALIAAGLAPFWQEVLGLITGDLSLATNLLRRDLFSILNETKIPADEMKLSANNFSQVVDMLQFSRINPRAANILLAALCKEGGDAKQIAKDRDLFQITDPETIALAVDAALSEESKLVDQYRAGKEKVKKALFGKVVVKLDRRGNPAIIAKVLDEKLK